MDDFYLNKMQKYENLCLAWIQKADQEFLNNNFQHSKQECSYLQQAVNLRSEMARISIGEEQAYHRRKARELNTRIAEIIRTIDPEYMKRKEQEAMAKKAQEKSKSSTAAATDKGKSASSNVDSEEVKSWFKDMPKVSFDDVVGMHELKKKLRGCIEDSKLQKIRKYLGIRNQKAYFFVGPPGCGKTYLIEAFAHELVENKDYKFISLDGSDILSKYVGDAEKTITRLFEEAEKNAPCIVFIDEVDGVCKSRSIKELPEYAASITTAFLTGFNRIKSSDLPIVFIGATNYPSKVDNAMMDRVEIINVPFPDGEGRALKFRQELSKSLTLKADFKFEDMAALTEDKVNEYNYRDVERLCEEIKVLAMQEVLAFYNNDEEKAISAMMTGEYGISKELFLKAKDKCTPTPKQAIKEEIKEWNRLIKLREEE
ncbi:MAG: AAA family ATPase [Lachnospiraceae bacterium]|nr:AAA family ATPase [Lachnospiraceae bacterium]